VDGSCEDGNERSGSVEYWEVLGSCTIGGFSRRAQLHEVSYFTIQYQPAGLHIGGEVSFRSVPFRSAILSYVFFKYNIV
jgi:hypothetical protein